jgi:hypothetical protein
MTDVLIRGAGVAAACCAHLLGRGGARVACESASRPRLPAILLGSAAQRLIADVFERPSMFEGVPAIRTRIVAWGRKASAVALPHDAIVISEEQLMHRLPSPPDETAIPASAPAWTVCTSQPDAVQRFGSRKAVAIPIELRADAEPEACWIESIEAGWLFLITVAPGKGWLLSVGGEAPETLRKSHLIAQKIASMGDPAGRFPAAPRIASTLSAPGWLACGSAAMAFDPLCGDGTAHAVREAILASAVIRAAARGEDPETLVKHYRARLTAALQRHLSVCVGYYKSGEAGPWWKTELAALNEGLDWCVRELEGHTGFRYRLDGFDLMRLQPAQ